MDLKAGKLYKLSDCAKKDHDSWGNGGLFADGLDSDNIINSSVLIPLDSLFLCLDKKLCWGYRKTNKMKKKVAQFQGCRFLIKDKIILVPYTDLEQFLIVNPPADT